MTTMLWTLIAIQIAMASFDTIYHHELTERLAWRPSQRHELKLHAARSLIYAVLFVVLGFFQVHGIAAMVLIAALVVEVFITLADFIEEDMSRKLPATERVNHTLLAINYGAILVLAAPVLLEWAGERTAIAFVPHGYWSALMALAAFGAVIFGLRDLLASLRPDAVVTPPEELVKALPPRQTVLVTGATGFIGRKLVDSLTVAGHDVIVLARDPARAASLAPPFRLITGLWQLPDDTHIDAIVNLAGEPVANGLWTVAKRHRILASRLRMTGNIVRLIRRLAHKPAVLVSASAIGWYGARGDETSDRNRQRPAVLRPQRLRRLGARRRAGRAVRCPCRAAAHRPRARHRRRHARQHAGAVRVRFWRQARLGPAVDAVDRARRHGATDRLCDCDAFAHRSGECDRARAGAQRDIHAGTWRARCIARRSCGSRPRRCGCSAATWRRTSCSPAAASCPTRRSRAASCSAIRSCAAHSPRSSARLRRSKQRPPPKPIPRCGTLGCDERTSRGAWPRLDPADPLISYAARNDRRITAASGTAAWGFCPCAFSEGTASWQVTAPKGILFPSF